MVARLATRSATRPDVALRRTLLIGACLFLWMAAIAIRLVYLQVSQHSYLAERARRQQQGAIETSPERGVLLDRQGRDLARSITTESIYVDPGEIASSVSLGEVASQLAATLKLDRVALTAQLSEARAKGQRFLWIVRRLPVDQAESIRQLELAGVHFRKEPKRFYPNGDLAAQVLGFVGIDGDGLAGVEQYFNQKITGEAGKLFIDSDSRGRAYEGFEIQPTPGQTIVLTIDQMVQYRTEQALASAVKASHAKSGTAIVLEPRTGEILALANVPTFDPNNVAESTPEARKNSAVQDIYEPGSTFKIVAYSAAIDKGLVKPDDRIDCQMGAITVAGRLIHDHHPFGSLTVAEALAKSSNVGAIKIGLRVGDEGMYEYMKRFGFGARTGIELPGETAGQVRPVERWQPSSIGSIAMGQEVGVTPLQMVAAFGTLANDGLRVAPHLVREIRSANGTAVFTPNAEQRRVVSVATARSLRGMLEGVTLRGTARKAQLDGYTAAGKTGTAQKIDPKTRAYSKTKYVASFVGFAPVNDPAVVIVVEINEPGGSYHGGEVAAPVFREIAEQVLPDLGVAPDAELKSVPQIAQATNGLKPGREERGAVRDGQRQRATLPQVEHQQGQGEVVFAPASGNAFLMPDLRGYSIRDVARACAQLGLRLEARGDGRVWRQVPTAGVAVNVGQVVTIDCGRVE
jgi:cell division protein FtsI/penicillin-binding protein 2